MCDGLWVKTLCYIYDSQGAYGRAVIFHTADKTVNAQVKKQKGVPVQFWSEIHNEVRVKYLTSIMFGHVRAEDVKEMLGVLDKLTIPLRLMLSLWNGWAQCEKIYNAQNKPGQERERLSTIGQLLTQLPDSHMSQQFLERYGSEWIHC